MNVHKGWAFPWGIYSEIHSPIKTPEIICVMALTLQPVRGYPQHSGETGTLLSPPIHRRLLSQFFLREGGRLYTGYRVQNVPGNSAKTSLAWLHFKTDHALRREENKPGWILRRTISWWKSSLPPQRESWAFFWTFSFHLLSFNGVFLTLKSRTLVLKHLHGDRAAAILLKMDIRH